MALEVEYGPMDLVKGLSRLGYQYGDYAEFAFGAAYVNYVIGTNSFIAEPLRFPQFAINPMVVGSPGFVADEMAIITTQDCFVRFNTATAVIHRLLLANSPYRFNERIYRIYVAQVAVGGVIYLHAEGNKVRVP